MVERVLCPGVFLGGGQGAGQALRNELWAHRVCCVTLWKSLTLPEPLEVKPQRERGGFGKH